MVDEIPEELRSDIESFFEEYDPSLKDLIFLQVEVLIEEAEDEFLEEWEKSDEEANIYSKPYESDGAMIWRLTEQIGIDADFVTWWLAAISFNDDGGPFYLVHERSDQIRLSGVKLEDLPRLAEGFQAVEKHWLEERDQQKVEETRQEGTSLPAVSEIPPAKFTDDDWEWILDSKAAKSGGDTLAIRRAPVLDQGSLSTYVLERRNASKDDSSIPIGAFWGHHGGFFQSAIEEAYDRLI
ncbi:hypothetical protein [Natronosalvus halobius]|uniref:hypothetical protein n=1 Tax=Natronosalvus halobius TaxID=2953746 RepID=UPI00209E01C2|nr:hypothetical protein [Natronosalvus halobius]USZ70519.1 hypothetical protein NGM15_10385 [Natronosalvus halobius]